MRIHVNGQVYGSWLDMKGRIQHELLSFLKEWFDDKNYVIGHTSGSTGLPKEIRLYKEDMKSSARITNAFLGIGHGSVLLLSLSMSYIAGKMMVVRALEADADLFVGEVSSRPLRGIKERIDLAALVPMQVEESFKYSEDQAVLAGIRQILIGGAPVSPALERKIQKLQAVCYATYGMTETVSHVALRRLGEQTCYFALGEVSFTSDDRGCLIIEAPHLQARRFVTNDLVERIDERHFKWLGRYDYAINSGGIKFLPEQIEHKIASCISCRYFITALPDERLGECIALVLEGNRRSESYETELLGNLRRVLTPYEMPKKILYLSSFHETLSGKVVREI